MTSLYGWMDRWIGSPRATSTLSIVVGKWSIASLILRGVDSVSHRVPGAVRKFRTQLPAWDSSVGHDITLLGGAWVRCLIPLTREGDDDSDESLIRWNESEATLPNGLEWWSSGPRSPAQRVNHLYLFDEWCACKPDAN